MAAWDEREGDAAQDGGAVRGDGGGAPDVGGLLGALKVTLSQLQAPGEVVVRDFEGREYKVPPLLPARRQMQVFREILGLFETGERRIHDVEATGGGLVKLLLQLVTDEATMTRLGRAFALAYPSIVAGAASATGEGERDPLDVFPIEEMIAALAPLALRFVRRSGAIFSEVASS